MENKIEISETVGLIFFENETEINKFKTDIDKNIIDYKYSIDKIFNEGENYIKNNKIPNWNSTKIYKNNWDNLNNIIQTNNNIKDIKHFRIVFKKYNNNIYYFEKNGGINFIDIIIKNYNFESFNINAWNNLFNKDKTFIENLNHYNKEKYKDEIMNDYNSYNEGYKMNNINITFNYNNDFDYFNFLHNFSLIKTVDENLKLIKYNKVNCTDESDKSSETLYNKLVYNSNTQKYIHLDLKKINGCEVADLYDMDNKLLYHIKKRGDLRVLSFQVMIGALIMKNDEKSEEYFNYLKSKGYNEKIDKNNFKYVLGIIGKNKKINVKDRLALGFVYFVLNIHKIELLIDYIDEE
jgi:hypothetical protein